MNDIDFINENPSGRKPYWAHGYPFPCCGNCLRHIYPTGSAKYDRCSLEMSGYSRIGRFDLENGFCDDYVQDMNRICHRNSIRRWCNCCVF